MKTGRITVETSDYKTSHGHLPRGCGSWLFCCVNPGRAGSNYLDHLLPCFSGTYAEARKQAVDWCRANGVTLVFVCS